VDDGKEHIVALRYIVKDEKWTIFLDGKEDVAKQLAKTRAVDPD